MRPRARFLCPACRGELERGREGYACGCGRRYGIRDEIPCFCDEDSFYEGRFAVPTDDGIAAHAGLARGLRSIYDRFSLTTVKHRFTREFLKGWPRDSLILDVGCGGGNELLAEYNTVGIDLSFAGLEMARQIYRGVAAADAAALPFGDATFDVISSWDFFGHVPFAAKDAVLAEWRRVLKPGGAMLHIIEADCTAPFYRLVQRDRALFQRYFIELDGHIGLELPSAVEARFREAGFAVERSWTFFRGGIFPPEEYVKRLDPGYARSASFFRVLVSYGHACERSRQLDRAATFVTGILARAVNPLLPKEWGSTVFLVLRG